MLLLLLLLTGVQAQITADSVDVRLDWSDDGSTQMPAKLVAATYRNAYGTHFECSSTCMLLLVVYAVLVVGGLLLLSLIPVRFASNEKLEAPFVLWFGSPKKKVRQEEEEEVQTESWWTRATAWVVEKLTTAPAPGTDVRYRFHADMTQQLAASAAAAKTYESIAVATDDLVEDTPAVKLQPPVEPPPPPKETLAPPVEALPPPVIEVPPSPPPVSPSIKAPSRSSIFMGAPPSPPSVAKRRQPSSRLGSDTKAAATGPRTSRAGSREGVVETKEDLVRAVSRRQSMEMRTEKRVAVAKEDVSYENLGDDEIRTYEYLEFVRELLDGLSLKKVCQKSGRVVSRKLYITPDMAIIFWNPIGSVKWMRQKSSLQTLTIDQVLKGLHGSSSIAARSSPERDALCVSIGCSNGKWLVLEAKNEAMRQRLFLGFSRLAEEKQHESEAKASEEAGDDAEEKVAVVVKDSAEKKPTQHKSEVSPPHERQSREPSLDPPADDDPSFTHRRDEVQSPADDVEKLVEEKPAAWTEMTQPAQLSQQPEDQQVELDEDTSPPRGTVVSKLWQSRMTTPAPLSYEGDLSETGLEGDEPQIDVLAELMGLNDEQRESEETAAPPLDWDDSSQVDPQRVSELGGFQQDVQGGELLDEATQEDVEGIPFKLENADDNVDEAYNRPEEEQAVERIELEVGTTDDNSVGDPESSRD